MIWFKRQTIHSPGYTYQISMAQGEALMDTPSSIPFSLLAAQDNF